MCSGSNTSSSSKNSKNSPRAAFSAALAAAQHVGRERTLDVLISQARHALALNHAAQALQALEHIQADPAVQRVMTSTLGVALLLTAAATLFKAFRGKQAPRSLPDSQLAQALRPRHWALPLLFGAVIGTLVTLTSVGAGAIGVTVLLILYPLLPLPRILPTLPSMTCTRRFPATSSTLASPVEMCVTGCGAFVNSV